jgi:lipase maturation factor 1
MESYAFSSWLFLRGLSLVYLIAFATLINQNLGLWGSQGILPIGQFLGAVQNAYGVSSYYYVPTLFWLNSSDIALQMVLWLGVLASVLVFFGIAQGPLLLVCFAFYLAFVAAGRDFLSFQWDHLLLEVGFLALFVAPWNFRVAPLIAVEPPSVARYVFYLVLFKLMFSSGAVKLLSGDPSWRDLTALTYHYWTQPLPNILAPFLHALPMWFQKLSTFLTFVVEIGIPFLIFVPALRLTAAIAIAILMFLILGSGNYAFFNWLTLVLTIWLIPDSLWSYLLEKLPWKIETVSAASAFPVPLSLAMAFLSLVSIFWMARWWLPDAVQEFVDPVVRFVSTARISSSYGLFANMTKTRPEIVIEGSEDGETWKEYEFPYKPGALDKSPPLVAPYQPRLDWQMWFAALGSYDSTPWFQNLLVRLMQNAPDVVALVKNPFPNEPPRFLRSKLYLYEFSSFEDLKSKGIWWKRTYLTDYGPTLERKLEAP